MYMAIQYTLLFLFCYSYGYYIIVQFIYSFNYVINHMYIIELETVYKLFMILYDTFIGY